MVCMVCGIYFEQHDFSGFTSKLSIIDGAHKKRKAKENTSRLFYCIILSRILFVLVLLHHFFVFVCDYNNPHCALGAIVRQADKY